MLGSRQEQVNEVEYIPFGSCKVYHRGKNKDADVPLFFTSEYGKLSPAEELV
jgi:hypothetical protein